MAVCSYLDKITFFLFTETRYAAALNLIELSFKVIDFMKRDLIKIEIFLIELFS